MIASLVLGFDVQLRHSASTLAHKSIFASAAEATRVIPQDVGDLISA